MIRDTFRYTLAAVLGAALTAGAGCGEGGPATYPVSGKVTFEGQPVAEGDILFRPAEEASDPAVGKIINGEYTVQATEGSKRVEITAYRETGKTDSLGGPEREQYIPSKYNTDTELQSQVSSSGQNTFNFDLTP